MTAHNNKQPIAPFITAHGDYFELRHTILYFIRLSFHDLANLLFTYLQSSNELVEIRNYVAHGELLFIKMKAESVFLTLLRILDQEGKKERANQMIFDLKYLCKKVRKTIIRRQYPAPEGWKKEMERSHWCKKDIKKLSNLKKGNKAISITRHRALRRQAALWFKALNEVDENRKNFILKIS